MASVVLQVNKLYKLPNTIERVPLPSVAQILHKLIHFHGLEILDETSRPSMYTLNDEVQQRKRAREHLQRRTLKNYTLRGNQGVVRNQGTSRLPGAKEPRLQAPSTMSTAKGYNLARPAQTHKIEYRIRN